MSKIRVDIRAKEDYIFAGEFLSFIITFKHEIVGTKETTENWKKQNKSQKEEFYQKKTEDPVRGQSDLLLFKKNKKKTVFLERNTDILEKENINDEEEIEGSISSDMLDISFGKKEKENEEKKLEDKIIKKDKIENNKEAIFDNSENDFSDKKVELEEEQENIDVFYDFNIKSHNLNDLEMNSQLNLDSVKISEGSSENELKETLLIGYIQIIGYFILNEKIINVEKFEEFITNKYSRKSTKDELVRIDSKVNQKSHFINNLNINYRLNNLLKNQPMSSLGKFKKIKKLKNVPILSTPPSILFIDLELAPGESRSYSYNFKLPSQLPPSYEGKSIKINYHLSIGTQCSGKSIQPLKVSNIPFEVLYKIDESGNQIIYDLFSPIIYLTDEAEIFSYDLSENDHISNTEEKSNDLDFGYEYDKYSKEDFICYLSEHLLDESLKKLLLSNSIGENTQECFSDAQEKINPLVDMKNIIQDITENNSSYNNFSNKKFNINKNGNIIGIISILKLSYKLGETIIGVIDFSSSKIPCYHVKFFLETTEIIDESITHCSKANISQTTRKIYDSYSETTLCASRIQFKLLIPSKAPFSFKTSGISLLWTIRLEITIPLTSEQLNHAEYSLTKTLALQKLLKENYRDYRETHYFASSSLECETFYCTIPIMVFPSLKSRLSSNLLNTTFYI
ncbi:hypothetical protein PNEG_02681 [Pneumocystis murina B123]|uniref:Rgp1-domain-containing protein n=1 Tax=Pneumocystis murina (strain B123) TaxID=1069680 RepID=M7NJV1_PNEMU|nr:hypothetical protein PNEG_02681 [Pneumocystis murina B123]EMR08898.1 hypothetical protein PNEG_02681 [Pneumocystis murina B123]